MGFKRLKPIFIFVFAQQFAQQKDRCILNNINNINRKRIRPMKCMVLKMKSLIPTGNWTLIFSPKCAIHIKMGLMVRWRQERGSFRIGDTGGRGPVGINRINFYCNKWNQWRRRCCANCMQRLILKSI